LPIYQIILGYIPLQQTWPTGATLLQEFHFIGSIFDTIKAVNTGMKQLNFINLYKHTYINVCNTFFSIWEHIKALPSHKITVLVQ